MSSPPENEMLWVTCVLWGRWPSTRDKGSQPDGLSERYVYKLQSMVKKWAPFNTRFICFTDRKQSQMPGVATLGLPELEHVRGWFNKLYLFSADAFPVGARVLYFDLDTAIVGSLSDVASVPLDRPVFLRDVLCAPRLASGVFSFRAGPEHYKTWTDYVTFSARYRGMAMATDEQWLMRYYPSAQRECWQHLLPGQMVSYKVNLKKKDPPPGTRVVFFHGKPRPHEVDRPWNEHGYFNSHNP